jgi:hypothetical protein
MRDARGRFLRGPDAARHVFTRAERRRGYRNAVAYLTYQIDSASIRVAIVARSRSGRWV